MYLKQYQAVIKAMEDNGGFATLSYFYENVMKVPNVFGKPRHFLLLYEEYYKMIDTFSK